MATYKLIQDIEAEDHILGPLTLRQFIYALVATFLYYIGFFVYSKGAWFLLIVILPPAIFFTFFALPLGKDQSTEIWALAKLRFFLKPRKRIWNQTGIKELVTITVPKKVEQILTDGLSQGEVKSRLSALANTLDSRGWVVKNVEASKYSLASPVSSQTSDRLFDIGVMPREVPSEVYTNSDVLDVNNNPVAQQLDTMITQSEKAHRKEIIDRMNSLSSQQNPDPNKTKAPDNYWFLNQPPSSSLAPNETMFASVQSVQPGQVTSSSTKVSPEEQALLEKVKASKGVNLSNSHLRTVQPLGQQTSPQTQPSPQPQPQPIQQEPTHTNPAIIKTLANNNDLNIATIARQAKKEVNESEDEVVISLH